MENFWLKKIPPQISRICIASIIVAVLFICSVIINKNIEIASFPAPLSVFAPQTKAAFSCSNPWPLRRALTMYARAANTARLNYIADHFELAVDTFGDEIAYIRQRNPNFRFVNYNSITDNYLDAEHDWLTANATAYRVSDPEDIYLHYSQDTVVRLEGVDITIRGWPSGPGATAQSRVESRVRVYHQNPARARYVTAFHTPELRALQRAYHTHLLNQVARGGGNQYWDGFMFDNASFHFLQSGLPSPSIPTGPIREAGGLYANSTAFYNWYYYEGFGLFEQELRTNQLPVGRRVWIVPNVAGSPVITQDTWQEAYVNRLQPGDVILKEFSHNPTRDFGQTLPATIFYKNGLAQTAGIDLWEFPMNITSVLGRQGSFTADEAMMNNLGMHWLTRRSNILTWGFVNIVSQAAWDNNMRGLFDTDLGQPLEDPQVLTTGTDGRGYAYTVYSRRFACGLSVVRVRGAEPEHFDVATAVTVNLPGTYLPLDVDGNRGASTSTATLRNGQGFLFLAQEATPPPTCTENWSCSAWSTCSGGTQTRTCTDLNSCGTIVNRPPLSQSCTPPPPPCSENWSCGEWSACVGSSQSRTCTDANNCGTTVNRPPLTQSCIPPPPPCSENWSCSAWSTCVNNLQSRTCTDSNACGTTANRPPLTQSCTTICSPNWTCGAWSSCSNNSQSRTCTDANNCGIYDSRPPLSQSCSSSGGGGGSTTPPPSICLPAWTCGEWSACTQGQNTRQCRDVNNCNSDRDRPPMSRTCGSTGGVTPLRDPIIVRPTSTSPGAYPAHSLLRTARSSTVYYIGTDYKKYVFPDATTYATWFRDFKDVRVVSEIELDKYSHGGVITYRPGTYLLKTSDSAKVYTLEGRGHLYWIPDEATAQRLYGPNWAHRVRDISPGFLSTAYQNTGEAIASLPTHSLVKFNNEYYLLSDRSTLRRLPTQGINANRFQSDLAITLSSLSDYTVSTQSIVGVEDNYFYLR